MGGMNGGGKGGVGAALQPQYSAQPNQAQQAFPWSDFGSPFTANPDTLRTAATAPNVAAAAQSQVQANQGFPPAGSSTVGPDTWGPARGKAGGGKKGGSSPGPQFGGMF